MTLTRPVSCKQRNCSLGTRRPSRGRQARDCDRAGCKHSWCVFWLSRGASQLAWLASLASLLLLLSSQEMLPGETFDALGCFIRKNSLYIGTTATYCSFFALLNSAERRDEAQRCRCKRKWRSQEATGKRTFEVWAETVSAGDGCHRDNRLTVMSCSCAKKARCWRARQDMTTSTLDHSITHISGSEQLTARRRRCCLFTYLLTFRVSKQFPLWPLWLRLMWQRPFDHVVK